MINSAMLLNCIKLTKIFRHANFFIKVLDCVNCVVQYNEIIAIVGVSGSGKSTLLHLLGGLDQPTSGKIFFEGNLLSTLSDNKLAMIRNKRLGFIYQFHHLLKDFSILENVAMPLLITGMSIRQSKNQAKCVLELVGLKDRISYFPHELSGGENQRVAIARAIINYPVLVLADEPTGNLDQENSDSIFDILKKLNLCYGTALLIATHDINLAKKCHRIFTISHGKLQYAKQCFISSN